MEDLREKYEAWVVRARKMHPEFQGLINPTPAWTPLNKPLSECRVALVTTSGVHLKSQEPFDLASHEGDWTHREIPGDVRAEDLMASHAHYDTDGPNQDINCVFPIDALRQLAADGYIGSASPVHIGMMGFVPHSQNMRDKAGPAVAARLVEAGVDAVFITPTGMIMGESGAPAQHLTVLKAGLECLTRFTTPGTVEEMPFRWRRMGV